MTTRTGSYAFDSSAVNPWAYFCVRLNQSLVPMAALALVFLGEKNWRHGVALSRPSGSLTALLGAAIIARPELLAIVSGGYPAP